MYHIEGYNTDLIGRTTPKAAERYLIEHGFELAGETQTYKSFVHFDKVNGDTVVVVPKLREYADYIIRMDETIKKVSEATGLTIQEILRGMMA